MAKYLQDTMNDTGTCPYCGSNNTIITNEDEYGTDCQPDCDEECYHCYDCNGDYNVLYDDDTWSEFDGYYTQIEQITDRHRVKLCDDDIHANTKGV